MVKIGVAKNPLKSALQKPNKNAVFHRENPCDRNLYFSASPLCPIFTRISALPDDVLMVERRRRFGFPNKAPHTVSAPGEFRYLREDQSRRVC
jgi:hypothetical protein